MIMEEEFAEVLQSFLEKSLAQHTDLHVALQKQDYQALRVVSEQLSDGCSHIGAQVLVDELMELRQALLMASYGELEPMMEEIDSLYSLCRIEIQAELAKGFKRTG